MTIQFEPSALAHRINVLDEIGVGPLWLRLDAVLGAQAPVALTVLQDEPAATLPVPAPVPAAPSTVPSTVPSTAPALRKDSAGSDVAWHDDGPASASAAAPPIKTTLTLCTKFDADAAGVAKAARYLFIARATSAEGAEELFDNILLALGMRKDAQTQGELSALTAQIASHKPSVLVLMDPAVALQLTGDAGATFESLRGRIHRVGDIPALVTYAAAHLLRNLADKRKVWDDLCMLMALDVADPA